MKHFLSGLMLISTLISFTFARASSNRQILIFGRTIRKIPHGEIIPIAGPALQRYFTSHGLIATFSQDPEVFKTDSLAKYSSIVLLNVSEGVLASEQKKAIERFFERGNGILAIHGTISAGKDWPWFQDLLGTRFVDHAPLRDAVVKLAHIEGFPLEGLPAKWTQVDEWYNFTANISSPAEILAFSGEQIFKDSKMSEARPVAWTRESAGSRFFYTSMGHPALLYTTADSDFLTFLLQAAKWTSAVKRESSGRNTSSHDHSN